MSLGNEKLELVVEVDTKRGNAAIKGVNKSFSRMEKQAITSAGKASKGIDGMSGSLSKLLKIAGGTAVLIGAYKAVKKLIFGTIELQDRIGKTAQQLGLSVKQYSEYRHVADLAGISAEQFGAGVGVLSKNMFEATRGNNVYSQTFKQLKVDFQNSDGTLRNVNEVLEDMADRYRVMTNETEKVAIARSIMGRSGSLMITALNQGSEAIRAQRKEAHELGIVLGDVTAKRAAEFIDNMARLKSSVQGVAFRITEDLLPRLNDLTDKMVRWVKDGGVDKMVKYLKEVAEWIKNIGKWIISFAVVSGILKMAAAIRTATTAIAAMNIALIASPWGLAALGVATFGWALWREYDKVKKFRKELEGLNKQVDIQAGLRQGKTLEEIKAAGYTEEQIRWTVTRGNMEDIPDMPGRFSRVTAPGYEWKKPGYTPKPPISDELQAQIDAALKHGKRVVQEIIKEREDINRFLIDKDAEYYKKKYEFENKLGELQVANAKNLFAYKQERAAATRDKALLGLDALNPQTPAQMVAIESKRAAIEIAYIRQVHEVKRGLFEAETMQILNQIELQKAVLDAAGKNTTQISRMIDEIKAQRKEIGSQIDEQTQSAIDSTKVNAAVRQMQIVRNEQQRTFDSFKRQAEGVFDALVTKSRSVFQAIGDIFKTAMLTAIKEVVTSHIARMLMQMFGGMRTPSSGGAGGMSAMGAVAAIPSMMGGAGGGSGTPPFMPSGGGGLGGLTSLGGLNFGSVKGFFGLGGERSSKRNRACIAVQQNELRRESVLNLGIGGRIYSCCWSGICWY